MKSLSSSEKPEVCTLASARDTAVGAVSRLWFGSIAGRSQRSLSFLKRPDRFRGPSSLFSMHTGNRIEKPRCEADYLLPSNAGVKNKWRKRNVFTHFTFTALCLIHHRKKYTILLSFTHKRFLSRELLITGKKNLKLIG